MANQFRKANDNVFTPQTTERKLMKYLLATLLAMLLGQTSQAETYVYTSGALVSAIAFNHSTCTAGTCASFNNTMHATGSITTASALPANQTGLDPTPYVSSFTFFDGVTTYSSADSNVRAVWTVDTDAGGNITSVAGTFERWQRNAATHVFNDHVDWLTLKQTPSRDDAMHNFSCGPVGPSGPPQNVADYCNTGIGGVNADVSYAPYTAGGNWTVSAAPSVSTTTSIPTLSEWGLMILSTLITAFAFAQMRRRV